MKPENTKQFGDSLKRHMLPKEKTLHPYQATIPGHDKRDGTKIYTIIDRTFEEINDCLRGNCLTCGPTGE